MGSKTSKTTGQIDDLLDQYQRKAVQGEEMNRRAGITKRESVSWCGGLFIKVQQHPKLFAGVLIFVLAVAVIAVLSFVFALRPAADDSESASSSGGRVPASSSAAPAVVPKVTTAFGTIYGAATARGAAFYAIPFAEPPTTTLRWKTPIAWTRQYSGGALNAGSNPHKACAQSSGGSEDCLYLNVYTPSATPAPGQELPVLFFVHGGGFYSGSGSADSLGGADLAATAQAVVVTPNYRLGPLGFLAVSELVAEAAATNASVGNYGLEDLVEALRWVRGNVAAFGGDRAHVLLFGQSAGAAAVVALACDTRTRGLFSAVLSESSAPVARTLDSALSRGAALVARTSCVDVAPGAEMLACLRGLSPAALLAAEPSPSVIARTWLPVVDGVAVRGQAEVLLADGGFVHVPVIAGSNADEGTLFVVRGTQPVPPEEYAAALAALFPMYSAAEVSTIAAQYPSHAGDNRDQLSAAFGDCWYTCTTRRTLLAASHYVLARGYVFQAHPACTGPYAGLGAFHGAELFYLFGHADLSYCTLGSNGTAVAGWLRQYWANFARTADPNSDALPSWPAVSGGLLAFAPAGVSVVDPDHLSKCDFWDALPFPSTI